MVVRTVFMGTPDFAVPSLEALAGDPRFEVAGVVTQPDRPAGRGQRLLASPIKRTAESHHLAITQPDTLRDPAAVDILRTWSPDICVVVAFGQILRQSVLEIAPFGCINVHASLLPRWRGAAPIQYAIRAGDSQTGVTIMRMDRGLDTGLILTRIAIPIEADETASSLHDKLSKLGADILADTLHSYVSGTLIPYAQPDQGITLAPTLKKSQGLIDWSQPASAIDRLVRAFTPWPGAYTYLNGALLKVIKGRPLGANERQVPGTLLLYDAKLAVQTGDRLFVLDEIQPAGKPKMSADAFLRGHEGILGSVLSGTAG